MAAKFNVQATAEAGLKYYYRGGRCWPRGDGHQEIELLSQAADDPGNQWRIGTETFKRLQTDAFLRITPAGDPMVLADAAAQLNEARARVAELEAAVGAQETIARFRIAELERENGILRAALEAHAKRPEKVEAPAPAPTPAPVSPAVEAPRAPAAPAKRGK
jgi:hypothetical protein